MTIEATDEKLLKIVEKIEHMEAEKKEISDDIRDVYAGAKAEGYEPKMIRQVVRDRKKNRDDRLREEQELEVYRAAVGLE